MMKLDKNTHILILLVFVLSFVVVYLYFTINDVRKLQREHKKLADDLVSLQQQIVMSQQQLPQVMAYIPPLPTEQDFAPVPAKVTQKVKVKESLSEEEDEDEDNESVNTEEIRNTLDNTDGGENVLDDEDEEVEQDKNNQTVQVIRYTQDELLTLKNDELKELCKKHQIPVKGSKEVLIKRLLSL